MPELLVVATPIGNLGDMSERMREALTRCDLIAAEDTRVTMKLLRHLGLNKPLVACHQHNEARVAGELAERMRREDLTVALTCDAGTPGISDPGVALVRAARELGVRVTPICGPSALATALSASGFEAREFAFYGFPPREKGPLREKLRAIHRSGIPVAVFYESPHRVVALVRAMEETLPGCRVSVCCDLSKLYESIDVGPCAEVLARLEANPNVEKGEYCLALDLSALPPWREEKPVATAEGAFLQMLLDGLSMEEAFAQTVELGYARNEVYRARLRVRAFLEGDEE